jgi:hypothetical protein
MYFNENPGMCRVDLFKHNGNRWCTTISVDMTNYYDEPIIHDALYKAICNYYVSKEKLKEMINIKFICLEP